MSVYYEEWEPYPAEWLRMLMMAGEIPDGIVDETDIRKINPNDLKDYNQCHFFAGIAGWPIALQMAGWPKDREVWTGSCPCQPFSVAGSQKGKNDDRHLAPTWLNLIRERHPATIFGEQVTGAIAHGWFDELAEGLEKEGYAIGSAIIPACSVGAPHKRDRLWFVADTGGTGRGKGMLRQQRNDGEPVKQRRSIIFAEPSETSASLANSNNEGPQRWNGTELCKRPAEQFIGARSSFMADSESEQARRIRQRQLLSNACSEGDGGTEADFWDVEPAVGRVANGILARSHKLRAYGNAIVPQVAASFIRAFLEAEKELS